MSGESPEPVGELSQPRSGSSKAILALALIIVLLGAGFFGYVEASSAYSSLRNRLLGGGTPQPVATSQPHQACWTTDPRDGLIVQPTFGAGTINATAPHVLVDTGAFISAAPMELATNLHIDLYSGDTVPLGSIFGEMQTAYIHNINITLRGLRTVTIPVAILPDNNVPYVLGRQGFLDQFNLQVNQSGGTFCLSQD